MKEAQLVKSLKDWLNQQSQTLVYKIHGNQFQEAGIPDLIGCVNGIFFGIECKITPNKTTKIQLYQLQRIKNSQGLIWIVNQNNILEFKNEFLHLKLSLENGT